MAWLVSTLLMLGHYGKNLLIIATVLWTGAAAATVFSAHLSLVDARELANEALVRLESEIERAQLANLTSQQANSPFRLPGMVVANATAIANAGKHLRDATDIYRRQALDGEGDFSPMDNALNASYDALHLANPEPLKSQKVHSFTNFFGHNWPIPTKAIDHAVLALVAAVVIGGLDAILAVVMPPTDQPSKKKAAGGASPSLKERFLNFGYYWRRHHSRVEPK